jgi:hypothetical protein
MTSYGEVLSGALKFSIQPKRWLPFFILDTVFFLAATAVILSNFNQLLTFLMSAASNPAAAVAFVGYAALLFVGLIVWALIRLWISGAIVHQSVKPKEIGQSWHVAKSRYLSLLGVSIVVGLISWIVGIVPFIGWILSIIVGLMFFFVVPAVIVKRLSFDNSLRDSYHIFRKNPLQVFFIWLVIAIISLVITGIFLIPLFLVFWQAILPYFMQLSTSAGGSYMLMSILSNPSMIGTMIVSGLILLVGIAISNVFALKATTEFYLHVKKKRFGFF